MIELLCFVQMFGECRSWWTCILASQAYNRSLPENFDVNPNTSDVFLLFCAVGHFWHDCSVTPPTTPYFPVMKHIMLLH
uniref:Putative secreted protein n=1 Tax=Ixodes ricinus TaxID=34613 RepID=A0A6B0TV86_IXORI